MSFFQLLSTVLPLTDRRRFSIFAFVEVLLSTLAVVGVVCDSVDFFVLTVQSCSGDKFFVGLANFVKNDEIDRCFFPPLVLKSATSVLCRFLLLLEMSVLHEEQYPTRKNSSA